VNEQGIDLKRFLKVEREKAKLEEFEKNEKESPVWVISKMLKLKSQKSLFL